MNPIVKENLSDLFFFIFTECLMRLEFDGQKTGISKPHISEEDEDASSDDDRKNKRRKSKKDKVQKGGKKSGLDKI